MLTGEIMTGILGKEPMMIRHILNNRVKILFTFDGKLFIIEMCLLSLVIVCFVVESITLLPEG